MHKDVRENFSDEELEYLYLSLISSKVRVGIIGGGKAAAIKAKSFLNKGSYVEVLSKEFNEFFNEIDNYRLILKNRCYNKKFIIDKHIIIIAVNDLELIEEIKEDCKEQYKLFIDATDFRNGMAVIPVQRECENICVGVSTKVGNPKGSIMVADEILKTMTRYDDFIAFTANIRRNAKKLKDYKKEIVDFICTEEFRSIYLKGKDVEVLSMFYDENIVDILYCK